MEASVSRRWGAQGMLGAHKRGGSLGLGYPGRLKELAAGSSFRQINKCRPDGQGEAWRAARRGYAEDQASPQAAGPLHGVLWGALEEAARARFPGVGTNCQGLHEPLQGMGHHPVPLVLRPRWVKMGLV